MVQRHQIFRMDGHFFLQYLSIDFSIHFFSINAFISENLLTRPSVTERIGAGRRMRRASVVAEIMRMDGGDRGGLMRVVVVVKCIIVFIKRVPVTTGRILRIV